MKRDKKHTPSYAPIKAPSHHSAAVAIRGNESCEESTPEIIATGRGHIAQEIIDIAFANGIKVREDSALAEILVQLDIDTPIPAEAIIAVSEILAKVYEANNAA